MFDNDFHIEQDSTIVRKEQKNIYEGTDEKEILLLEHAIFRHPENYSEQELNDKKKQLDELWKKYGQEDKEVSLLEYSIFVHPERCSEQELDRRKKRLDVLSEKYGKKDDFALSLKRAKMKVELLDKKKSSDDNSLLKNAILNLKKSKDTGV